MKQLGKLLQHIEAKTFGDLPAGACELCLEFHECHYCHDARFVRRNVGLDDPDFGKRMLCPRCNGYSDGVQPPTQEQLEDRLRIPSLFQGTTLDILSERQAKAIRGIVTDRPTQPMLTLAGNVGTGKTTAAVVALKESLRITGRPGRFWPVVDLLERFKASFDEDRATETTAQIEAEMRAVPLLVLDDIGKQKSTEWAEERVFKLVDERYRSQKPLIVTTNVPRDRFDDALASRLFGTHSKVVEFTGADRRMQ